jgi:hypothetical protein
VHQWVFRRYYHNVVVPTGASCTLSNTRVTGSVTVQAGGSFFVSQESAGKTTIAGNVTANQCGAVMLESIGGTTGLIVIGGNLTITNCTSTAEGIQFDGGQGSSFATPPPPSPATVPPTLVIGGSVKCDNNSIPLGCQFDDAFIGGNFECSGNSGGCGLQAATISGNATLMGNGITEIENGSVGGSVNCANNGDCDVDLNAIGKGVTLTGNGSGDVGNNAIGGSLNCVGNTGGVGESTPNTIAGITAGQCLGF